MRGRATELMFRPRGHVGRAAPARLAVLVATVVAAFVAMPAAAAATGVQRELPELVDASDGIARALGTGDLTEAEAALERALALVEPERARRLFGPVARPSPHDGMAILRDLAARTHELPPRKRAQAERILARPTDRNDGIHGYRTTATRRVCDPRICIWWVTKTSDRPALADRNRNGIPDYVDRARAVFRTVWRAQIGRFGYRKPRSDRTSRNHGPNGKLDVYIGDVGARGLYGYCTTDDPARARRRSVSSYCVIDNDFARKQYGGVATGLKALKVTAAHEFFHAVQYGYDWLEDLWLMEGTATWIEDEIFDGINDNRQYLRTSPLSQRFFFYSLDYYNPDPAEVDAAFKYGAWIFWRYLSERFGRDVVKAVWRRADARAGAPNEYSARAVVSALTLRRQDFPTVFADFGVANLSPATSYREGAAYPSPRPTRTIAVTDAGVGRTAVTMFHLANDYYEFTPSGLVPGSTLTLELQLPPPAAAPRARALVHAGDGTVSEIAAAFDETIGRWVIPIPNFDSAARVVLVLTNASTRYACWRRQVFSCQGRPRDDVDFYFSAAVTPPPEVEPPPEEPPPPPAEPPPPPAP